MTQQKAAFPSEFKTIGDKGQVEALISVYDNVDLQGDKVVKGAFAGSIARWRAKGDPIPVVVSHDYGDLWQHIGSADPNDVEETDEGLKATYTLDIKDNPVAAQAFRLMKRRTLKNHSFTYDVQDFEMKNGVRELKQLEFLEFGPTLLGANPSTDVLAVKSALEDKAEQVANVENASRDAASADGSFIERRKDYKAGRRISSATRAKLEHVQGLIAELLEEGVTLEDEGKSADPDPDAPVPDPSPDVPVIDEDLLRLKAQISTW